MLHFPNPNPLIAKSISKKRNENEIGFDINDGKDKTKKAVNLILFSVGINLFLFYKPTAKFVLLPVYWYKNY